MGAARDRAGGGRRRGGPGRALDGDPKDRHVSRERAFRSWLYRIVANAAYQKVRDRRAQPGTTSLDEAVVFVRERSDPARRTELRTALTAAIDELPAGHRTTLLLREVEGRSNGEISRALGLPVPNVKARVHRARTFLRRRLAVYRGLMSSEG